MIYEIYDDEGQVHLPGEFIEVQRCGGAHLGYFRISIDDPAIMEDLAIVVYDDGHYFLAADWQSSQPDMNNLNEVERTRWYSTQYQREAIMIDGLPCILI